MYTLACSQLVRCSLATAWDFVQSPANLDRITPDDMRFEIVSDPPAEMYDGLLVEYRVGIPFLGSQRWVSEIKHVRPLRSFVDEQREGPYSMWYHLHELEAVEGGVVFRDTVCYRPPFWILGRLAHALFIGRTLRRIFEHRNRRFLELLDQPSEGATARPPHAVVRIRR